MITESVLELIRRGRDGSNQGISIGMPKLESIIDGLTRETYYLLFGGTGSGKTTLALYSFIYKPLVQHLDDDDFRVIYYSLEMSANMLFLKLLCMHIWDEYHIEVSPKELMSRKKNYILDDDLYRIVLECQPWLTKIEQKITVYDRALNAQVLYANLHSELEKEGEFINTDKRILFKPKNPNKIILVVMDHIGLVRPGQGSTLKSEIDLCSKYLLTFRNICGISPLVLMQINRDSTSTDRRKLDMIDLKLSDIKDSGNPSQDAEVILGILSPFREQLSKYKKYDINQLEDRFRSISVLKSRYGESEIQIGSTFYGKAGLFKELPKGDQITCYDPYMDVSYMLEDEITQNERIDENIVNFNFTM